MRHEAPHEALVELREALAALLDRADVLGLHVAAIHIANAQCDIEARLCASDRD